MKFFYSNLILKIFINIHLIFFCFYQLFYIEKNSIFFRNKLLYLFEKNNNKNYFIFISFLNEDIFKILYKLFIFFLLMNLLINIILNKIFFKFLVFIQYLIIIIIIFNPNFPENKIKSNNKYGIRNELIINSLIIILMFGDIFKEKHKINALDAFKE